MNAKIHGAILAALGMVLLVGSLHGLPAPASRDQAAPRLVAPEAESPLLAAPALKSAPVVRGHLHPPPEAEIERRLRAAGHLGPEAGPDEVREAVAAWLAEFEASSWPWGGPEDQARLLANERAVLSGQVAGPARPITAVILVLPVEFGATETLTYQVHNADGTACITTTDTFSGPLHGRIPYPGGSPEATVDNFTLYYPSTEPADYERLIFGRTGYTQPLRSGDPNVNGGAGADLSGLTVQSYFDAQSDGTVEITGTVAPWVRLDHSEAYYGLDRCVPNLSSRALPDEQLGSLAELTVQAVEALKARGGRYATYDFWKRFDADDDGVVDALWIIHSGRGQEYGGGAQGEWALWSRSSDMGYYPGYENGYTVHDNGTPETEDDVRIGPFVLDPEDSDIGVLIEEFGHSLFGLPDLYTMNSSNSVGWWAPMSAGIWGGELAGTRPVNMPLWFRLVADCNGQPCGWADPVKVLSYTAQPQTVILGQAGEPAGGKVESGLYAGQTIYEGLRIDLPDQEEQVPNRAGKGGGAYSGPESGRQLTLARPLDLTAATTPLTLTFGAYWRIRRYWGYAYLELSTDGGQTFESIPDLDGHFTADNPYGLNQGFGMTGEGQGRLRFDLSPFAGQEVVLRFRYLTYQGAPGTGWWIDDVHLPGVLEEDFEAGLAGWSAAGWKAVPYTLMHPHYYLVEWRNASGFDQALTYAYSTSYHDQDEWRVDRVSADVPGAVVMYRNFKYPFSGAFQPQLTDPPSIGSKYALLVVDPNFWPVERPSGLPFSGRLESLDAALSLHRQPDYTLEVWDQAARRRLQTETLPGRAGVARFDDALGYYPGFYTDQEGNVRPWDEDASAVVPSRDGAYYSTRITHGDRSRPHPLDGTSAGNGHFYGSGNPGDDGVALGVRLEAVAQAPDGSWGAIRINDEPWPAQTTAYLPVVARDVPLREVMRTGEG